MELRDELLVLGWWEAVASSLRGRWGGEENGPGRNRRGMGRRLGSRLKSILMGEKERGVVRLWSFPCKGLAGVGGGGGCRGCAGGD